MNLGCSDTTAHMVSHCDCPQCSVTCPRRTSLGVEPCIHAPTDPISVEGWQDCRAIPPRRALRDPTHPPLDGRWHTPASRAGRRLQRPARPGGPLRDPGALSRPTCTPPRQQPQAQAPWGIQASLAPWNSLAPAQSADERAGATASNQVRGNVRSHPVPRHRGKRDKLPSSSTLPLHCHLSQRKAQALPQEGSCWENCSPPSMKKQLVEAQRKFQNPESCCWRGFRIEESATSHRKRKAAQCSREPSPTKLRQSQAQMPAQPLAY